MENLVPQFILDRYAQGETGGRFAAVGLFADISGFSAVTHALMQHGNEAAEAMADVMLAIFTPLVAHIHAHGGFITTFAGDAFTALFPLAEGDGGDAGAEPTARALAAAVGVQRHMIDHATYATPYGTFPFAIKLGLGDGEVDWGILRPHDGGTPPEEGEVKAAYFFSGPAIEAAAAAEGHAQSGNLILSPGVHARVASRIKAIPVGDAAAEGGGGPGARYARLLSVTGLPEPAPVEANGAGEARAAVERAFIPAAILQRATYGDFRQVVSVFVKLMGIETGQDLAIFMQSVFALQQQLGGYLNRIDFGDKGCTMVLYWGMPTSTENDIERALDFVLELGNHTPGTFRAGITFRPMYAGLAGSPARGEYTCYGDGINLAARLAMAAPWGTVWLDDRIANRAGRAFALDFVDEVAFKGFDDRQAVYALVERRQDGEGIGFQGQMVGRRAELAQLAAFVAPLFADTDPAPAADAEPGGAAAAEGAPVQAPSRFAGLLVIQGDPGAGKSRLAYEFLTDEAGPGASGAQIFVCQTDQVIRQPLNPFRYWLHHYFDQSATQSEARNKRAFGRKLDQVIATVPDRALARELNRVRSFLGALVDLTWESSLYAQLDSQGRFENTLSALKTLLKAESLIRPAIVLLEDAQWLDADSIEFLRRLGRNVDAYPLAVLATARPERDGALFGEGTPYEQIDLGSLTPEDMRALIADRLGGPVDADLTELLMERSECNPFFAEQIMLYLREQGAIASRRGAWRLVRGAQESALPADVRTVFVARLDRLEQEVKEIVQTAAVLGREFEVPVLVRMMRDGESVGEQVRAAERETIWLRLSQVRYLFKHSLLRDAAYEMQLRARRCELHQIAARALAALYADDLAPHTDKLAYHTEAAVLQGAPELRPQAVDFLEKAGARAAEAYENAAAVDYVTRALALVPETEIARRFDLLLAREALCHLQGAREQQAQDLALLAELAETFQEPARQAIVGLREAKCAYATGNYALAILAAEKVIGFAQAAQDPATEVSGHVFWGSALERSGDDAAACEQYTQALDLARAAGDRAGEGDALRGLGIVAWHRGERAAARGHYLASLEITRELGDRRGEGATLNNLGLIYNELGEYGEAQVCYGQALAIRREIGDRAGEGSTLNNLGLLLLMLGSYAEARVQLEQSLAIWREIGSRPGEVVTLDNLGFVTRMLGEYETSLQYLSTALALERGLGARKALGWTLNNLGSLYLALGDLAQAEAHFEEALALRQAANQPHYVAEDLAGLASVALARGDRAGALARVDALWPILEADPTLEGAEHALQALVAVYHVLHANEDPRAAPLVEKLRAELEARAAKIADPELRQAFLESAPEHRELLAHYTAAQVEAVPGEAGTEAAADEAEAPEAVPEAEAAAVADAPGDEAEAASETGPQAEGGPDSPDGAETARAAEAADPAKPPLTARIPLQGAERSLVIVIENLNINFNGAPGVVVESDVVALLRELLGKG